MKKIINYLFLDTRNKKNSINKCNIIIHFISLIQIILSGFISPKSQDMARSYIRSSNIDFFSSIVKPGKFVDVVEDLTIFIEKENKNGFYENIYLKDDLLLTQ